MITHNGTYLFHATHHGMPIVAATMGGKMILDGKWLLSATQLAIVAAFGAEGTEVIRKTNDYLNRIATTDPQRALQISGFINEDPLLVCSLVETSKVRTLDGDGKAYINTLLNPTGDLYIACLTKDGFNSESYAVLFGASKGVYTSLNTNAWNYGVNTDKAWGDGARTGKLFEVNKGTLSVDGLVVQVWNQQTFEVSIPLFLYADNNGTARRFSKAKMVYSKINREDTSLLHFAPFQLGKDWSADKVSTGVAQSAGANGMLDIISGTFYPNANTQGAFTIAITDKV